MTIIKCGCCNAQPQAHSEMNKAGFAWRNGVVYCGECRRYCSAKFDSKIEFYFWPYNKFYGIDHFTGDVREVAKSLGLGEFDSKGRFEFFPNWKSLFKLGQSDSKGRFEFFRNWKSFFQLKS